MRRTARGIAAAAAIAAYAGGACDPGRVDVGFRDRRRAEGIGAMRGRRWT